jgi:hypothetical protein
MEVCAFGSDLAEDDWRKEIIDYLEDPSRKVFRKLRYKAIKFVFLDGSLFYKSLDGVLLQCLGPEEAKPSLYPWSSGSLPKAWGLNCLILLLIMPKLMDRQRLPTRS